MNKIALWLIIGVATTSCSKKEKISIVEKEIDRQFIGIVWKATNCSVSGGGKIYNIVSIMGGYYIDSVSVLNLPDSLTVANTYITYNLRDWKQGVDSPALCTPDVTLAPLKVIEDAKLGSPQPIFGEWYRGK